MSEEFKNKSLLESWIVRAGAFAAAILVLWNLAEKLTGHYADAFCIAASGLSVVVLLWSMRRDVRREQVILWSGTMVVLCLSSGVMDLLAAVLEGIGQGLDPVTRSSDGSKAGVSMWKWHVWISGAMLWSCVASLNVVAFVRDANDQLLKSTRGTQEKSPHE